MIKLGSYIVELQLLAECFAWFVAVSLDVRGSDLDLALASDVRLLPVVESSGSSGLGPLVVINGLPAVHSMLAIN